MIYRLLIACCLTFLIATPAAAQDLDKGFAAYQRGDFATALREWRPLAEAGDIDGRYGLGVMYDKGRGVPEDNAEAVRWYRLATEQDQAKPKLRPNSG